jgi:hypothetical protein
MTQPRVVRMLPVRDEADGLVARVAERRGDERHDLEERLARLQDLAAETPDIVLPAAADGFFEAGDGAALVPALSADLDAGWNVFEFTNVEFHMTDADDRRMRR